MYINEPVLLTSLFILFIMFLKIIWSLNELQELKQSVDIMVDLLAENSVKNDVFAMYQEEEEERALTKEDLKGD